MAGVREYVAYHNGEWLDNFGYCEQATDLTTLVLIDILEKRKYRYNEGDVIWIKSVFINKGIIVFKRECAIKVVDKNSGKVVKDVENWWEYYS